MALIGLDAMNIRRIEAGILNAGSDFDNSTTPYDVGLGRFVDDDKADFIGKAALANAGRTPRLFGLKCLTGEPMIGAAVTRNSDEIGKVTAGATSPYLQHAIGIALLNSGDLSPGADVQITCGDGQLHAGELVELPFYDKQAEIPRGKLIDIPDRR